jgi:glycosyltransferase involved in cell wall biosynthesis
MPLISIIIPVYNIEKYVSRCIDSVLSQTFTDFECLLVNDGSSDNSLKICNEYAVKDNRVITIHQNNLGLSAARNTGIHASKGNYLVFLDGDDFFTDSNSLFCLVNIIDTTNAKVIYSYKLVVFDDNKKNYSITNTFKFVDSLQSKDFYNYNNASITHVGLFSLRRDFLVHNGLFFKEGILHEDELWIPRVICAADTVIINHNYFYTYRKARIGSIMSTINPKRENDLLIIIKELFALSRSQENPEKSKILIKSCVDIWFYLFTSIMAYKYQFNDLYKLLLSQLRNSSKVLLFQYKIKNYLVFISFFLFGVSITHKLGVFCKCIKKIYIRSFGKFIHYVNKIILCLFQGLTGYITEAISLLFDRQSIRIAFVNFRGMLLNEFTIPLHNYLGEKKKMRIVTYHIPHIFFFSVFGNINTAIKSKAKHKIFFTGENVNTEQYIQYKGNCIDFCSLSMGFDFFPTQGDVSPDTIKDNYIRFPLWLFYFFNPFDSMDIIRSKLDAFKTKYEKSEFCALIASHDNTGIRTPLYELVSKVAPVDCAGKLFHNDNLLKELFLDDKTKYLQQYKFNICPENSISPGYVTEKIFQALYSGCIPIYTGWNKDPEPGIINPNIILWYDLTPDNMELVNEISRLHFNDRLYKSFMEQDFFLDTAIDKIYHFLQEFVCRMQKIAVSVDK